MKPFPEKSGKKGKVSSALVIGGGIAGLTMAWKLSEGGVEVRLLESGLRAGGAIETQRERGYIAEHGPNTILETDPGIAKLISSLGLDGEKRYAEQSARKRFVVKHGIPRPLPMSPQAFLTSDYFSWKAKLSLLGEPFRRRHQGENDESLADFVLRRLGQEFLDYAVNPFVAGVYAGVPNYVDVIAPGEDLDFGRYRIELQRERIPADVTQIELYFTFSDGSVRPLHLHLEAPGEREEPFTPELYRFDSASLMKPLQRQDRPGQVTPGMWALKADVTTTLFTDLDGDRDGCELGEVCAVVHGAINEHGSNSLTLPDRLVDRISETPGRSVATKLWIQ